MIRKYKKLLRQVNWFESNVAWKWQVDRLQSEMSTLKNVLVEAGILVRHKEGIKHTVIIIDGDFYTIRKAK